MNIIALHGFLGRPDDWHRLFQGHALQDHVKAIDLFKDVPISDLCDWAGEFNRYVGGRGTSSGRGMGKGKGTKSGKGTGKVLLGYSLGARLALHALLQKPESWDAAVIISGHMGLASEEERAKRKEVDEHWARRFENDRWETLLRDWNGREVFQKDTFHFVRNEEDYVRSTLALALRKWSLSNQERLTDRICQLPIPILWIAGEEDHTYARQALQVQDTFAHPLSKVVVVPQAGHRMPWQYPQQFVSEISNFFSLINKGRST